MKWRKLYREAVEEVNFKKLLKQNGVTKLPSGTQFKPDRVSWSKDGGYAGQKTLDKICSQLEDAGWKRGEWRTGGIPDGSAVTNSNAYTSPDGQLVMTYSEHYGATAHDNFYGFTFKLAGTGMNESDEEDSFTRSDRPQIYRYYDDDETPLEDFVKHVHSAEQEIEDIFIQNSDVYENADDPWELFCDDIHGENETLEESLDLDYYMNNAAYEQLPEDIKKYVYRSGGSCDFDAMQWLRGIFERLMPICKDQYNESSRFNVGDKVVVTIGGVKKMKRYGEIVEVIEDPRSVPGRHFDNDGPMYVIRKTGGFKDDPWGENPEFVAFEDEVELADGPLNESSRFGFNVGDDVELTSDVEPNRFSDRGAVPAGTVGEIVAVDKPMRGVIKVKIEDGSVVSVPERKLKFAGTENEPWEKFKTPAKPKPTLDEILAKHGPEEIYMEPARPGYPKWTGD